MLSVWKRSVTLRAVPDRLDQPDETPAIPDLDPVADTHPAGAFLPAFSQLDVR